MDYKALYDRALVDLVRASKQAQAKDAEVAALKQENERLNDERVGWIKQMRVDNGYIKSLESDLAAAEKRERELREGMANGLDEIDEIVNSVDCHYAGPVIRKEVSKLRLQLLGGEK